MSPAVVFIYCPKSGDRVLREHGASATAHKAHPDLAVIRWQNGSRHVIGGVHLIYEASQSGRWWRTAARTMATALIHVAGGIAWDEQGAIHLVVPVPSAYRVDEMMDAARAADLGPCRIRQDGVHGDSPTPEEVARNQAALILCGAARPVMRYAADAIGGEIEPVWCEPRPLGLVTWDRSSTHTQIWVDDAVVVRAPAAWYVESGAGEQVPLVIDAAPPCPGESA